MYLSKFLLNYVFIIFLDTINILYLIFSLNNQNINVFLNYIILNMNVLMSKFVKIN